MTSPTRGGGPEGQDGREGTPPLTKEQIEGHISAMKSIIKDHNKRNKCQPIRQNFEIEDQDPNEDRIVKGKEIDDEDLTFQPTSHIHGPLNQQIQLNRFVWAANSGECAHADGANVQPNFDGSARGWFESLPPNSIDEWWRLREAFTTRYSTRKACYKEPHEITKIVRKANETLTAFKERWTVETGFIIGVPEVMKISSFMDSVNFDAEEAYSLAEITLGEHETPSTIVPFPDRVTRLPPTIDFSLPEVTTETSTLRKDSRRATYRSSYKVRDNFNTGRHRDYRAPYPQREHTNRPVPVLSLDSLTKCPKEILATETQLQLPPPRPVANPVKDGRPGTKYCIIPGTRYQEQRVERRHNRNPLVQKVINMVNVHSSKKKKRKDREATESWMNTHISFPPIMTDEGRRRPLIIESRVEEYLVSGSMWTKGRR
ncbi:reverse transcriptase domain-containing protein [Tanacetum coccineum]